MYVRIVFFLALTFVNNTLFAFEVSINEPLAGEAVSCSVIEGVFFDLGGTLFESNGMGMFVLRDGAAELIEELQIMGIRIGIITNVPANWTIVDLEMVLVDPNFLDKFEAVIISSEAPAPKPDPAIFNYAYSLLPNPPAISRMAFVTETLLHIADSETNPTQGARATGMIGIHLSDNVPSPFTEYTIDTENLGAVADIIMEPIFCHGFEAASDF